MNKFEIYATDSIRNVPIECLSEIIELAMKKCSLNMGSNFTDDVLQRTVELIKEDYSYMTVNIVVSALFRGSMGYFGAGRLIPKTIAGWLREVNQEYQKERDHKEIEERLKSNSVPMDLVKYPMGKALCKKIDWLTTGAITFDEWDIIPLRELAEMIGNDEWPMPEYFGVEPKN